MNNDLKIKLITSLRLIVLLTIGLIVIQFFADNPVGWQAAYFVYIISHALLAIQIRHKGFEGNMSRAVISMLLGLIAYMVVNIVIPK